MQGKLCQEKLDATHSRGQKVNENTCLDYQFSAASQEPCKQHSGKNECHP